MMHKSPSRFNPTAARFVTALALKRYVAAADLREGSQVLQDLRNDIAAIPQPARIASRCAQTTTVSPKRWARVSGKASERQAGGRG